MTLDPSKLSVVCRPTVAVSLVVRFGKVVRKDMTMAIFSRSMRSKWIKVGIAAVAVLVGTASAARAQESKVEIGASMASAVIGLGDNDFKTFGVPAGGFGLFNPGLYASIFVTPKIAIEPQFGLQVISAGGDTETLMNLNAPVDYFLKGADVNSLYVFGGVGLATATDVDSTTNFGGGVGYRIRAGDRLAMRADGRLTHHSDGGGNTLSFTFSIGGLFGKK